MSLDFQQIRQQVVHLGEQVLQRQVRLENLRVHAQSLLGKYAGEISELRQQAQLVVRLYDPALRCALPVSENLNARFPLPALPVEATVLAADGSQIFMDRHAEVQYGLVNAGAIQMRHGSPESPSTHVRSQLFYHDDLERMTDAALALRRDVDERRLLAELAGQAPPPVITFTDGPMELWGALAEGGEAASAFQQSLEQYLEILEQLHNLGTTTAGYVDRPGADLVIRLLEIGLILEQAKENPVDLAQIRKMRPLQGLTDLDIYIDLLLPGERSAVFALQSKSARQYSGALALHFFYLNVGADSHPYLARVEIPEWVAQNPEMLDNLQAILVYQSRMMGPRQYPYLLHRAHETAVVTHAEQEQVTQMIVSELQRHGFAGRGLSHKQASKDSPKRTRHGL
jgi:hypothetical protein